MTGGCSEATQFARNLIAGLADGDVRVVARYGGWVRIPASQSGADGVPLPARIVQRLVDGGLLERDGCALMVTARGLRFSAATPPVGAAPEARGIPAAQPRASRRKQTAESPLEWLHTRRGADGEPLISQAAFDAGERLRADYTRAGFMPRLGPDLTGTIPGRGRKAGARGPGEIMDAALMARDRVNAALTSAGSDLAGVAVDICCHLKSLGEVERERGWPKRSAKVVLDLALSRLAAHYGIGEVAKGPVRARRIEHWGAVGYRPDIE